MEHLYSLLRERGISPIADWDGGILTYLHTHSASVSIHEQTQPPQQRFRVEHVNSDGNPTRTILVALARVDDVVRLVEVYIAAEHRARLAQVDTAKSHGAKHQAAPEHAERRYAGESNPAAIPEAGDGS